MTHRVVITGMGCISPLGNTAAETWSAAVAGRSGIGRITHFDTTGFDTQIAAEVKGFDPVERFGRREARRMDRFSQLALTATDEALKDSGLTITEDNCERIGVYIGTGIGGLNTCSDEVTTL
ncbi:MAG TPA: beta-ketoacyl synthase N-terminal-like domain-containing protein, partial [Anaerolineales bacterium]|nr:beta-ketoacyl synthase N-terminal-like domain-containing protein [Anaerolineales bacterium]